MRKPIEYMYADMVENIEWYTIDKVPANSLVNVKEILDERGVTY